MKGRTKAAMKSILALLPMASAQLVIDQSLLSGQGSVQEHVAKMGGLRGY